jgi:hypothetical protein
MKTTLVYEDHAGSCPDAKMALRTNGSVPWRLDVLVWCPTDSRARLPQQHSLTSNFRLWGKDKSADVIAEIVSSVPAYRLGSHFRDRANLVYTCSTTRKADDCGKEMTNIPTHPGKVPVLLPGPFKKSSFTLSSAR